MNSVCHDIFKAIHEDKWLSIEYKNKDEEITRYWIGVKRINLSDRSMVVEGLHLAKYTTMELKIYIDSILQSSIIEGSYFEVDCALKEDIELNPGKYKSIFYNVANLKILNYLAECNRLDCIPYKTDYALIRQIDEASFQNGSYYLTPEQFQEIVSNFQIHAKSISGKLRMKQLALNVLSIHTKEGLYVLAYRKLKLDVKRRTLLPDKDITICTEFVIGGCKQSIRRFLDADDYQLLEDFEKNAELIKDRITTANPGARGVDDMPYFIAIGRDIILDLNSEYTKVAKMYQEDSLTDPLKAFFGDFVKMPDRRKDYPIALLGRQINLNQLLAIHNGMKYPLTYIQGPPGTGKSNTILNMIITAFFNGKSVLFTTYNNHPIDEVCKKLQEISYRNKGYIPFPVIRLGDAERMGEALDYIKALYEKTKDIPIFDSTLERNRDDRIVRTRKLTALLKRHEEKLDLLERKEALERLWEENQNYLQFQTQLAGVQMRQLEEKMEQVGEVTDEEALKLVLEDEEEFKKYLYYTSAKFIKRLGEPKNEELLKIVYSEEGETRVRAFTTYLSKEENVKKFLRIFPIVAVTSISAHKIGEPKPHFDITIMDEASQGNIAISLVPIIRGKSLMLVGDPQQLSPVILLDPIDHAKLKKMYGISDEYDYMKNSIYKTFLACDAISGEILLSHHYRCHKKIIAFNNKKYYNNKLIIDSVNTQENPLVFWDVADNTTFYKNTAPREAEEIANFAALNKEKSIGVITPFTNQKDCINEVLKSKGISNVTCGTVHAFQGDEKDIILFSLALTNRTSRGTYEWLKNNRELINVATSRARDQLVVVTSKKELERLHTDGEDDMYELLQYVASKGTSEVHPRVNASRALGIKPYSTETEKAFLENLQHALGNVLYTQQKCSAKKEVAISQVFEESGEYKDLFYTGRFDFVVYQKDFQKNEYPVLAIELDGLEHFSSEVVRERDRKKNEICRAHGFELIRIENSYARRYNYMKQILIRYFANM